MILLIDNYDSFTYNLAEQLLRVIQGSGLCQSIEVRRNDEISPDQISALSPSAVVISPGPGGPTDSGVSAQALTFCAEQYRPFLGVCLGHQLLAHFFGAKIIRAHAPRHGKVSFVNHNQSGIMNGSPLPLKVARYHSLIVDPDSLPSEFSIDGIAQDDGAIMALSHKTLPLWGVQFHPESFMTPNGDQIINSFLRNLK